MKTTAFTSFLKAFHRETPDEIDSIDVRHRDRVFKVVVKRAAAARRLTLRIRGTTGDIVLTIPTKASLRQAHDFAQRHAEWLANRLARIPQRTPFLPGARIPLRGVEHILHHCPKRAERTGPVWVERVDGALSICASGEPVHFERRVADYLRREARRDIEQAVSRHAAKAGRRPISLSLRDTSSRWGSCSAKGALNFSWRLILAPSFVLDYLAAHETAHLRHHDHSENFWALTKSLCPRTEEAEAWLKAHGAQLHRYGRRAVADEAPAINAE
ncbi:M48 family metallopeptidase [Rhodoblastus acidophilus]|uniref:M48 family metallopeptidase n=1 Tax=Candidatus Rhodoblastus alkanivorans TaxID=2954117 RepID=A0ABS9Z1A5_9HYPH|nr:SprT family zinc-dependent metalloprotease [Candidatus Rhodoblastus alkanivorans]MCI4679436.1 M48 family metallopeptidase [Candidatus Rhodoblastus alkanivorans]MCI4681444.1 M48 family metallopeptidase [Candidatus Rhodoblastus alkanivorans]MDI4642492.1 M48 family metallopeptidase [Rhodoblastus acidophilus]